MTFNLEDVAGTLLEGKRKSDFTQALERLLKKYCGTRWEYKWDDDSPDMWVD